MKSVEDNFSIGWTNMATAANVIINSPWWRQVNLKFSTIFIEKRENFFFFLNSFFIIILKPLNALKFQNFTNSCCFHENKTYSFYYSFCFTILRPFSSSKVQKRHWPKQCVMNVLIWKTCILIRLYNFFLSKNEILILNFH